MNAQKEQTAEQKLYSAGTKEAAKLEKENGKKAAVIQQAYEAAVKELGYSDRELMDTGKAKQAAKLMFSDKYLGNSEFNPLLKDKDFEKKGYTEQQRTFEQMLDLSVDAFVRTGGIIDRHGGLRRSSITDAVERHYSSQEAQRLMSLAWSKVYDPNRSLGQNIAAYAEALQQDPILSGSGAKVDAGKFESIDDAAQTLASSLMGRTTREAFQYRHGAEFN